MSKLIKQFDIAALRHCMKSIKACKIDNAECTFESKFGIINFLFDEYSDADICLFKIKRNSGDGLFIVLVDDNEILLKASSTRMQDFTVNLTNSKKVIIKRPSDSNGEISILSIELHSNDKEFIQESDFVTNWKGIIAKCKEHTGLRVVDGKLYANENGSLQPADIVESIVTNPPNKFAIVGNSIKFISSCEVVHIKLKNIMSAKAATSELYKHMEEPPPIIGDSMLIDRHPFRRFGFNGNMTKMSYEQTQATNIVVYDSNADEGLSLLATDDVKVTKNGNKQTVLIPRNEQITIPLSILKPYSEYIFTVVSQKVNGNGKIDVKLTTTNSMYIDAAAYISVEIPQSFSFTFKTGRPPESGQSYAFNINRLEGAVGDVVIHNIIIVENIVYTNKNPLQNQIIPACKSELSIDDNSSDNVLMNSKKFSRFISFSGRLHNNIEGNICANTFSGLNWFNKIKPIFPKLNIINDSNSAQISLCSINSLLSSKNIYLEPFNHEINNNILINLNNYNNIFTSSLRDLQYLKSKLVDKNIKYINKPWTFVDPQKVNFFENKEYILSFHRNYINTNKLLKIWKEEWPTLVLVGARGNLPNNIISINEYLSYDKLLYILLNSMCIIDMPVINDYSSSLIHLAAAAGIPVVSSNWCVLDKPNSVFLISNEKTADVRSPSESVICDGIMNCLGNYKNTHNDLSDYNTYTANTLFSLLSYS